MRRRTLCISWLNGAFAAAWHGAGTELSSWSCPESVTDSVGLVAAVREARNRAGSEIRRIAWAIDHRNLLFHVQETPPVKGRLINAVLDRLVAESRFYEEPAVWAKLALPPLPRQNRWLLALLPRSLWSDLQVACDTNGLDLVGVYPASILLSGFLAGVASDPKESVLLASDLGGALGLLVGRGDGRILFSRSIPLATGGGEARLDQEINRTLHFIQQRFGNPIQRLITVDAHLSDSLANRHIREGLVVECLISPSGPACHAIRLANHTGALPLDVSLGRRPQPAWVRPALALGLAASLVASSLVALLVRQEASQRRLEAQRLKREQKATAAIAETRDARLLEARRLQRFLSRIQSAQDPSLPVAFSRFLQETLPPDFRLTRYALTKTNHAWQLQLEGASREQGSRFLTCQETFVSALASSVFQVRIDTNAPVGNPFAHPPSRDRAPFPPNPGAAPRASTPDVRSFAISGWIQ